MLNPGGAAIDKRLMILGLRFWFGPVSRLWSSSAPRSVMASASAGSLGSPGSVDVSGVSDSAGSWGSPASSDAGPGRRGRCGARSTVAALRPVGPKSRLRGPAGPHGIGTAGGQDVGDPVHRRQEPDRIPCVGLGHNCLQPVLGVEAEHILGGRARSARSAANAGSASKMVADKIFANLGHGIMPTKSLSA